MFRIGKPTEVESILVVSRSLEMRGEGESLLIGTKFLFGVIKRF